MSLHAAWAGPAAAFDGDTLEAVRKRGHLLCGVAESAPGLSKVDDNGHWSGLEVDFCRAVAAAVLSDASKVKFRPLSEADRTSAFKDREVDILLRATTWTTSRDTEWGLRFVGTLFYDGQGLLVRRSLAISSVLELSGASICALSGELGERALADYFRQRQMRFQTVASKRWEDLLQAYSTERCTLLSGDISTLALERSRMSSPGDHTILSEMIAKEPKGPAVALGDEQWFAIVRWVLMALIGAEELGLTRDNVDEAKDSPFVEVQLFLGAKSALGQSLGLLPDWAYQIVKQAGNYGELYQRNLGARSDLKLERGANELWTRGGLMFAPPFR